MSDLIDRQVAIEAIARRDTTDGTVKVFGGREVVEIIKSLPSAEPERLTDDDFEAIRIHLNAYKEKLCNQQRWEEADEYQRIIDRFMAFASAQPEWKTARWIHKGGGSFICSDCGEMVWLNTYRSERAGEIFRYCQHCGAYMGKDEE